MFDIGVTKLAIIGGIALVVIGPEKLPSVARTIGTLLGRARRYASEVQAEVGRSMELEELRKMQAMAQAGVGDLASHLDAPADDALLDAQDESAMEEIPNGEVSNPWPRYNRPNKKWRVVRSATPFWYKSKSRVRTSTQSGAARVARFRPYNPNK